MKKRLLTCVLACSVAVSTASISSITSLAVQGETEVLPADKITAQLAERIDNGSEAELPVVLWLKEVSYDEIEARIMAEIGYNLDSLEVEYPAPSSELVNELSKASAGEPDDYLRFLMERHMELTASARAIEKERTDLYQSTRLSALKELNTNASHKVLESIKLPDNDVFFVSSYAPMILCWMTSAEIQFACQNSDIKEVDYYTVLDAEECLTNFGTTKATVGIDRINAILSLNGSGVGIGIYEPRTVSSQYYSNYGLNSSQVTVLQPEFNDGHTHSTYCAGIAAGSNGIAPSAHIYSATSKYDFSSFDTTNYDNAVLPNLENLLSYADIVSMSFGYSNNSDCYNYLTKYIDFLISQTNKVIVCATGNEYDSYIRYPSSAYNCIAVNGFVDEYAGQAQELLNAYSYKHGDGCFKPDVIGPSLNNGTSTATPYIAGMIALMYQYKPSLKARPELTKAILLSSCHRKCNKLLNGSTITDLSETMEQGLTDRQGAGIPDMYRMISIVSQHTYGHGVLNASNSYERDVNFIQPTYNSSKINISMAYLQTNVPSGSTSGMRDDYDITVTNNNSQVSSTKPNSSTEMVYKALTTDPNYKLRIYKYNGQSTSVRYGYAWSTDNERYFNNRGEEGLYFLKNYKSALYLSRDTSNNKAYQTSYGNALNNIWVLDSLNSNSSSYSLKNANLLSSGLGLGAAISNTNYYALEGSGASVSSISVSYDAATGTYTFKRTVNGSTYALGINGQSTSSGAYANWTPYSANNASQRWYLETVNYRSGDANYNGAMQENDKTIALQYLAGLTTLSNNLQAYLLDANKDNTIDVSDAVLIAQLIAGS